MPDVSMRTERVEGVVAGRYFSPAIIFSETDDLGCGSYRHPRWYTVRFGQNELPDRTDDSISRRSPSISAGMPSAAAGLSYVRPLPAP